MDGITDAMHRSLSGLRELAMDREACCAAVHEVAKSWTNILLSMSSLSGIGDRKREKSSKTRAMVTHSSTLAWKIPRKEEPGRLQSMGSLRFGHD